MITRLALSALLLAGSAACARTSTPRRVYVVSWARGDDASPEQQDLVARADSQLRAELRRCGALVADGDARGPAILLRPTLEVLPRGLRLSVVGVRDQKLLGTISMKASGSTRDAQLRALVSRACVETSTLE